VARHALNEYPRTALRIARRMPESGKRNPKKP
jgi:hypothetical protein